MLLSAMLALGLLMLAPVSVLAQGQLSACEQWELRGLQHYLLDVR
jgi:hypothetical protein